MIFSSYHNKSLSYTFLVIAAGISQGKSNAFGFDTSFSKFQDFRNDEAKRDFVTVGSASGVSAAFGAPIGGVLFSLEEGASFWSTKLTWRAFMCSMTTIVTLFAIRTAGNNWGKPDQAAMFGFGEFYSLSEDGSGNYNVWELGMFTAIGAVGGVVGALFNFINKTITNYRHVSHSSTAKHRYLVVIVMAMLMSLIVFGLPVVFGRCSPLPTISSTSSSTTTGDLNDDDWSSQETSLVDDLVPFYCKKGEEYNQLASIYFTDSGKAIKQLLHFREEYTSDSSTHTLQAFSSTTLLLFFIPYFLVASFTYGIRFLMLLFIHFSSSNIVSQLVYSSQLSYLEQLWED